MLIQCQTFKLPTYKLRLAFIILFIGLLILPLTVSAATNKEEKLNQSIGQAIGKLMVGQSVQNRAINFFPTAKRTASNYLKENNLYLTAVVTYPQISTSQGFQLAGKVVHRDVLLRTVISNFKATGTTRNKITEIHNLILEPFYSPIPHTAFFYIRDNGTTAQQLAAMPFDQALKTAQNTAVKLNGKNRPDKNPQNYVIALFIMEPRPKDEKIELQVPKGAMRTGAKSDGTDIKESSWHALFVPIRVAINNDPEQFFKVSIINLDKKKQPLFTYSSYTLTKKLQIALNSKDYNTGIPDGIFGNNTRKNIISFQKDHNLKTDGQQSLALLKLVKRQSGKNGIKTAQNILQNIGYDPGVADGKAGRKTHIALRNFQKDFSLKQDGSLTAQTLDMLLFLTDIQKANRYTSKMWPNLKVVH